MKRWPLLRRALAALLILALLALGLGALWRDAADRFERDRADRAALREETQAGLRAQGRRLDALAAEQQRMQAAMGAFQEELRRRYAGIDAQLQETLEPFAVVPDLRQYSVERVAFLLHIAQYKHTYLHDIPGALGTLRQTGQLLDALDEARYQPLMQLLAQAIATLDGVDPQRIRDAHRTLSTGWATLDRTIGQLRGAAARQDAGGAGDGILERWSAWLAEHVQVERGAPQALHTVSAYRRILSLHAVQTELYLARLSLQTLQPERYAEALARARALLTEPALDERHAVLLAALDRLLAQPPFPPAVPYATLLRALEQAR